MGMCTRCGVYYCNCPENGVCNTCLAKQSSSSNSINGTEVYAGCGITSDMLTEWKRRIECAALQGFAAGSISIIQSYVISAWNYRSNPCMFQQYIPQIQAFIQLLDINYICKN